MSLGSHSLPARSYVYAAFGVADGEVFKGKHGLNDLCVSSRTNTQELLKEALMEMHEWLKAQNSASEPHSEETTQTRLPRWLRSGVGSIDTSVFLATALRHDLLRQRGSGACTRRSRSPCPRCSHPMNGACSERAAFPMKRVYVDSDTQPC